MDHQYKVSTDDILQVALQRLVYFSLARCHGLRRSYQTYFLNKMLAALLDSPRLLLVLQVLLLPVFAQLLVTPSLTPQVYICER